MSKQWTYDPTLRPWNTHLHNFHDVPFFYFKRFNNSSRCMEMGVSGHYCYRPWLSFRIGYSLLKCIEILQEKTQRSEQRKDKEEKERKRREIQNSISFFLFLFLLSFLFFFLEFLISFSFSVSPFIHLHFLYIYPCCSFFFCPFCTFVHFVLLSFCLCALYMC